MSASQEIVTPVDRLLTRDEAVLMLGILEGLADRLSREREA